jgi:hypothetical protein
VIRNFVSKLLPLKLSWYSSKIIVFVGERRIDDEDDVHVTKLFVQRKKGGGPRRS